MSGTYRLLLNFDSHTVATPSVSMSATFKRRTSPTRIPVTHNNPITVSTVAAHIGGSSALAAFINAVVSAFV